MKNKAAQQAPSRKLLDRIFSKEYEHVKHGGTVRCTICNCVSSEDIETTIGDYRRGMSFVPDPITTGFICTDCQDVIQDQRFDYELMDNEDD